MYRSISPSRKIPQWVRPWRPMLVEAPLFCSQTFRIGPCWGKKGLLYFAHMTMDRCENNKVAKGLVTATLLCRSIKVLRLLCFVCSSCEQQCPCSTNHHRTWTGRVDNKGPQMVRGNPKLGEWVQSAILLTQARKSLVCACLFYFQTEK